MYKSPIELLVTNVTQSIESETEEMVFKAVQKCFPNVDRNEMFRALKYDRDQYEMGYADGKNEALSLIVRCKDCANSRPLCHTEKMLYNDDCVGCTKISTSYHSVIMSKNDFCSYGERRE